MNYAAIAPLLIVAAGALLGVLAEALVPRKRRYLFQVWFSAAIIVVALARVVVDWFDAGSRHLAGFASISVDSATLLCWAGLLVFGLGSIILAGQRFGGASSFTPMGVSMPGSADEREAEAAGGEHSEVFPLMLFALTGMLLFPAATDLLTAFIGLEVLSLPLYLLTALARRRRLISHEAALKYFLLGAFSSAIFLYGAALTYGFAGSADYAAIDASITQSLTRQPLLLAALVLLMVGLLFKVGAVPFHAWVPDTYTGAPTPVTAYMAVGTKVASFGAMARLLYVAFGGLQWTWMVPLGIVAALTMGLGAILGLTQTNIKRLLAYSSIAHAGFVLAPIAAAVGVVGVGGLSSMTALVYYLTAYGLATLGAFAIVLIVRDGAGEASDLSAWSGLGRSHPWLASAMTLFLCSLAGIPATAGFIGKVDAFVVAWRGGLWWLVLVGLVFSLVAMAFYMRVVLIMWFGSPSPVPAPAEKAAPDGVADDSDPTSAEAEPAPAGTTEVVVPVASVGPVGSSLSALIAFCAAATLVAGLVPNLFTQLASLAGQLLR